MLARILFYNIREGLIGNYAAARAGEPAIIDPVRYQLLVELLRSQQATIVGLTELWKWTPADLQRLADETGYQYAQLFPARTGIHLGVLAHETPQEASDLNSTTEPIFWHCAPRVRFADFDVYTVHLTPKLPEQRTQEAQLLARCVTEAKRPAILGGDFNAPRSREYSTDLFNHLSDKQRNKFGPAGSRGPVDHLVESGLIDLLEAQPEPTVPTASNRDVAHAGPPLRLDYCVATRQLAAQAATTHVVRSKATEQISDHYPLLVELEL